MLCVARALGNSRESSRRCCPGAIPPTKGTFTRCCRATIFTPRSVFRERALVDIPFCPQHLQRCQNCPLGAGRARHRLKQLNMLLSLAIRRGLATGWLRRKDTESWHQTLPASLPTFWSYVKRSTFKPAHLSQGIKRAAENCPFFLRSAHSCSCKTRRLGKWHNLFTLLQLLNMSGVCENNGI